MPELIYECKWILSPYRRNTEALSPNLTVSPEQKISQRRHFVMPPHRGLPRWALFRFGLFLSFSTILALPQLTNAQDADSLYRFGLSQLEEGDYENAINTFRKVIELDPNSASAHCSLGYIYLQYEDIDQAQGSFNKALTINDELASAYNGLGLVLSRSPLTRQEALESYHTALRIEPDYPEAQYNLGITYADMGNAVSAMTSFSQLLAANPDYQDVLFRIGLIHSSKGDYSKAEEAFKSQYRLTPDHRDNRLELGRVYLLTENHQEAEEILLSIVSQYPDYSPALSLLADLYMEQEDFARANQLLLMSEIDLSDTTISERLWSDVVDIASEAERREYQQISDEDRSGFFRRFWLKRDPDPTTSPGNEVLEEHYNRLRYAREHFRSPTTPGQYDDRGRIYIRHGPPDEEVGFSTGGLETYPNYTWVFSEGREKRLIIHFVDRGLGYFQRVDSLMDASIGYSLAILPKPTASGLPNNLSELTIDEVPINAYRDRGSIDPIYDRIANTFEEIVRLAQETPIFTSGFGDPQHPDAAVTEVMQLLETERFDILQDITILESTTNYLNIISPDPLPFSFYTATYREDQNHTRVEVYYGISTTELGLDRYVGGIKARVNLGIAVFDEQWKEITRTNEIREFHSSEELEQQPGSFVIDLSQLRLLPGYYNIAISVTDLQMNRSGVFRGTLRARDFADTSLSISDIEMAGEISSRRGSRFYRELGLEILPMPSRLYSPDQKIYIYYEVYNLQKDEFGTTAFQTSYTVSPANPDSIQDSFSSAFPQTRRRARRRGPDSVTIELDVEYGIQTNEAKWLELQVEDVPPGLYDLRLTIKDVINNTEYTHWQRFMVTEPPK